MISKNDAMVKYDWLDEHLASSVIYLAQSDAFLSGMRIIHDQMIAAADL